MGTLAAGAGRLVLLALLLFLPGCGQDSGGAHTDPPGDSTSGALFLQAVFGQSACIEGEYTASPSGNVCNDYLIDRIGIKVIDVQDGNRVAAEDQWECNVSERASTIGGVKPSGNIKVILQGYRQGEDQFSWEGVRENIVVAAGKNTDAGRICLDYKGDDQTPPVIERAAPSAGSEVLPRSPSITLQFSEDIVPESLTPEMLSLTKGTAGPVLQCRYDPVAGYDATNHQATIVPETELEGLTEYTLTVSSADGLKIQDRARNEFDQTYSWTFATAPIPKIWYVDGSIATSGNGESWGQAFRTIQEGIDHAEDIYSEVWVKGVIYELTDPIEVNKPIGIYGGFHGFENSKEERNNRSTTIIQSARNSSGSSAQLEHLIVISEPYVTIDSFWLLGNGHTFDSNDGPAFNGGSIYGQPFVNNITISNCRFDIHFADSGGAIFFDGIDTLTIKECEFSSNHAVTNEGGAIVIKSGYHVEFINCRFNYNSAENQGGAISLNSCEQPFITNCVFNENYVRNAGAKGGAFYSQYSSPKVLNCTFFRNQNDSLLSAPGGIEGFSIYGLIGSPTIINSIFWNIKNPEGGPFVWNEGPELVFEGSTPNVSFCDVMGGFEGDTNIKLDPSFVDRQNSDYRLTNGSPCIDKGTNDDPDLPALDYDGNTRKVDGITIDDIDNPRVDMGAFEFQPSDPQPQ